MSPLTQSAQLSSQPLDDIPHRPSRLATSLWWTMLLSCIAIAVYSTRFFLITPADDHFSRYLLLLRLHIAGGIGALLSGPWQFSAELRARALNLHRWLGHFYLLEVALASIAGLAMAVVSEEGLPTHLRIVVFDGPASLSHGAARKHRGTSPVDDPQLRPQSRRRHPPHYMPLMLFVLHWSFRHAYITVSWLCWIPNLLIAEWIVHRTRRQETGSSAPA